MNRKGRPPLTLVDTDLEANGWWPPQRAKPEPAGQSTLFRSLSKSEHHSKEHYLVSSSSSSSSSDSEASRKKKKKAKKGGESSSSSSHGGSDSSTSTSSSSSSDDSDSDTSKEKKRLKKKKRKDEEEQMAAMQAARHKTVMIEATIGGCLVLLIAIGVLIAIIRSSDSPSRAGSGGTTDSGSASASPSAAKTSSSSSSIGTGTGSGTAKTSATSKSGSSAVPSSTGSALPSSKLSTGTSMQFGKVGGGYQWQSSGVLSSGGCISAASITQCYHLHLDSQGNLESADDSTSKRDLAPDFGFVSEDAPEPSQVEWDYSPTKTRPRLAERASSATTTKSPRQRIEFLAGAGTAGDSRTYSWRSYLPNTVKPVSKAWFHITQIKNDLPSPILALSLAVSDGKSVVALNVASDIDACGGTACGAWTSGYIKHGTYRQYVAGLPEIDAYFGDFKYTNTTS
ncbi:hypothetical protein T439DRAFT_360908 [Meredithblackwellia eburnea MCA 4105]